MRMHTYTHAHTQARTHMHTTHPTTNPPTHIHTHSRGSTSGGFGIGISHELSRRLAAIDIEGAAGDVTEEGLAEAEKSTRQFFLHPEQTVPTDLKVRVWVDAEMGSCV